MNSQTVTIIGQGYVGLPLAQAAATHGWRVYGYDISQSLVENLRAGISHVDDISNSDLKKMREQGYTPTSDPTVLQASPYIVICVPTPLGDGDSPDLTAVEASIRTIGQNLSVGTTVILESTTYPGTTDTVCRPLLESISGLKAGVDFEIAYSPERVDPGRTDYGIHNTPKVVGGDTTLGTRNAVDFYSTFVERVVPLSGTREAETAKLLENTFRHVNIALVNEMAKFCHELDIDIWEVIRGAATKPFGFMKFTPGPGVGGHCIPIDPNYLSYEVRRRLGYPFRFVELAQEINNSMPGYVVDRVGEILNRDAKAINGSNVLILGVTYKPNIADQRESPAVPTAEELLRRGARVTFHDPHVKNWRLDSTELQAEENLERAVKVADVVVILQNHTDYVLEKIVKLDTPVLDTRGTAPAPAESL